MRTVVIHLSAIGDFLLSCSTLPALRAEGPVELVGRRERLQLAVDGGLADAAHDADACQTHMLFSTPSPRLREFLGQFDRCVAWLKPDDEMLQSLRSCGLKQIHAHAALPPKNWTRHASAYFLDCLSLEDTGPTKLRFPKTDDAPGPDVVIQPGSGGRHKNWPVENFQAVADELGRRGRRVVWCTGPAEEKMKPLHPLLGPMSLSSLGSTLAHARLYIGNDSGITHLAAAAGCPTLAIFGPTDPAVWAPRGEHVQVAGGKGGFPSVEEVLRLIA